MKNKTWLGAERVKTQNCSVPTKVSQISQLLSNNFANDYGDGVLLCHVSTLKSSSVGWKTSAKYTVALFVSTEDTDEALV